MQFVPSISAAVFQRELKKGFEEEFTCSHPLLCSGVSGKVLVVPAGASILLRCSTRGAVQWDVGALGMWAQRAVPRVLALCSLL